MSIGKIMKDAAFRLLRKPFTRKYPLKPEPVEVPDSYRGAIGFNSKLCVGCMLCVRFCPSGAIAVADKGKIAFDLARCIYCRQCAEVCPKRAIKLTKEFELVYESIELFKQQ